MGPGAPARGFAHASGASAHAFAPDLDDSVVIGGADGHHLVRVRRLRVGEGVTVADGAGRWRPYEVAATGGGRLELTATGPEVTEPDLVPGLAVAFALGKGAKPERVVAGLTELGVDRIIPFRSTRSVVRWDEDRAAAGADRLRRVAREAAMQCRRARLPEVDDPVDVAGLPADGIAVVGHPGGMPLGEVPTPGGGWMVVVGPEGGLDATERAALAARPGAVEVAVGRHVLRTETAAVAIAAAFAARRADHPA